MIRVVLPAQESEVGNRARPTERVGYAVIVFETTVRAAAIPILINVSTPTWTISSVNRIPNRRRNITALN
jgi:hypothetical protein